jgi:hypothetical protein
MAFWVFGASIAVTMLFMSLTGRLHGGVWLSMLIFLYALVWIASVSAYTIAVWMARDLPSEVNLIALGRARRPDDAAASRVWFWTRASWYGWLAVAGFLGLLSALASIGTFVG